MQVSAYTVYSFEVLRFMMVTWYRLISGFRREGDKLDFLVDYFTKPLKNKFFIAYVMYCIGYHVFALILQTYYIIFKSSYYFFRFGSIYLVHIYPLVVILVAYYQRDNILATYHAFWTRMVPYKGTNAETHQKIALSVKILKLFMIANSAMVYVAALLWMCVWDAEEVYLMSHLFKENLPDYYMLLHVSYILTFPFLAYVMLSPTYVSLYVLIHGRFYKYIFDDIIEEVTCAFTTIPEPRRQLEAHIQRKVRMQLVTMAGMHWNHASFMDMLTEQYGFVVLICGLSAISIGTAVSLHIRTMEQWSTSMVLRFACFGLAAALNSAALTTIAQELANLGESEHQQLCSLPWYYFDRRNKKLLHMILTKTIKPLNFSLSSIVVVNNELLVKLIKAIWSAASLMSVIVGRSTCNSPQRCNKYRKNFAK